MVMVTVVVYGHACLLPFREIQVRTYKYRETKKKERRQINLKQCPTALPYCTVL